MTVANHNGGLRVVLTPEETANFGLDGFFLDIDSPIAGKTLLIIFKTACKKARFKTDVERLNIEIHPFFTGGCEVLFTPETEKKRVTVRPVPRKRTVVAEFKNSSAMLDGIEQLYKKGAGKYNSSLFSKDGCYRLTLKQPYFCENLECIDCEVYTSSVILAVTFEHWTPICLENAIETVGKALKKD